MDKPPQHSLMFRVTSRLRFIEPQLASPVEQPTAGKHWIHEIKHDGYRSQVMIERGQVRVFSRNGHDWSNRYPGIVRAAAKLHCKSAIIDGEAIVQDDDGRSDFESLQSAIKSNPIASSFTPSTFCISTARTSDRKRSLSVEAY